MKKWVSILLLLLYFPAFSGISIDSFYCCGDLNSVHFYLGSDAEASNTTKPSNGLKINLHCCDHVIQSFQIQDPQQRSLNVNLNSPAWGPALIFPPSGESIIAKYEADTCYNTYLHSPPSFLGDLPLFIRNESFLI